MLLQRSPWRCECYIITVFAANTIVKNLMRQPFGGSYLIKFLLVTDKICHWQLLYCI